MMPHSYTTEAATFPPPPSPRAHVGVHDFESGLSAMFRRKSSTAAPAPVVTAHTSKAIDPGLCCTASMTNGLPPPSSPNVGEAQPDTVPPSDTTDRSPRPVDAQNGPVAAPAMDGPMQGPSDGVIRGRDGRRVDTADL